MSVMVMRTPFVLASAVALMASLVLAGPAAAQAKKDSAVLAMTLEPPGLDPTAGAASAIGEITLYNIYEPLTKIKTLPYHKKSIGTIAGVITKIIGDAEIPFPWDILRSLRSDLTLDSALMILLPDVNYPKLINKYLRKHQQRQRKAAMSMKTVRPILAKYSKNIDVPIKLAENVYFEGEYLRRRARKYAGYISKAAMIGRYLFRGFTGGCFFASFASVLLLIYQKTPFLHIFDRTRLYPYLQSVPRLGTVLWVVLAVAALYLGNEMAVIMRILENPEPSKTGGDRR